MGATPEPTHHLFVCSDYPTWASLYAIQSFASRSDVEACYECNLFVITVTQEVLPTGHGGTLDGTQEFCCSAIPGAYRQSVVIRAYACGLLSVVVGLELECNAPLCQNCTPMPSLRLPSSKERMNHTTCSL